jgi:ribonuclease J
MRDRHLIAVAEGTADARTFQVDAVDCSTMRARIHRGAAEVGGTCVEFEAGGARLVLDVGWPIIAGDSEDLSLPDVAGLADGLNPNLLGVVISHPHVDHWGLLPKVGGAVPVYIGEAASRILGEAAFFSPVGIRRHPSGYLRHRQNFHIGPFHVTPFLNDHSAFDAYSLLIEADGRRLFYTADLRAHGRKAGMFEELLRKPPKDLNVMLLEGTHVREDSDGSERGPSERDVEDACVDVCRETKGMVLAMFSPQNIDRLVTMYRACLRSGRDLVIDLYTAAISAATGRNTIPGAAWERVRVYLPRSQKARVIREQAFERTDAVKPHRIYADELVGRRGELVILFRPSMSHELEAIGCLEGALAIWSLWLGYLREPSGERLRAWLDRLGIKMVIHHASGHAFIPDLQRLVSALAPDRVVPIHSFAADRFEAFFPRVERRRDGEWWDV